VQDADIVEVIQRHRNLRFWLTDPALGVQKSGGRAGAAPECARCRTVVKFVSATSEKSIAAIRMPLAIVSSSPFPFPTLEHVLADRRACGYAVSSLGEAAILLLMQRICSKKVSCAKPAAMPERTPAGCGPDHRHLK